MADLDDLLARVTAKQQRIARARPLPKVTLDSIRDALRVEHTYASNAIEGNTLDLIETRVVLEGLTVAGKPLRDHLEAVDHAEAFDYVEALADRQEPFTEADLRSIHALVLRRSRPDDAGRYRHVQVLISGSRHRPPDPTSVPGQMWDLMAWLGAAQGHPIAVAAEFHARLATVHPFVDGNGRTARLASNLLLMRAGYPPATWLPEDRRRYFAALEEAHEGRYMEITALTAETVERTCDHYYLPTVEQTRTPDGERHG